MNLSSSAAQNLHVESHFRASNIMRDIGMADGLTVPFALAAGLSGAVTSSHIIITAGLAEIVAGSVAMRLGGILEGGSPGENHGVDIADHQKYTI